LFTWTTEKQKTDNKSFITASVARHTYTHTYTHAQRDREIKLNVSNTRHYLSRAYSYHMTTERFQICVKTKLSP